MKCLSLFLFVLLQIYCTPIYSSIYKFKDLSCNLLPAPNETCAMDVEFTERTTLNVHIKGGGVISYAFSERPFIKYTTKDLVLTTTKVKVIYPIAYLNKLTFSNGDKSEVETVSISEVSDYIYIFSTNGILMKAIKPESGLANSILRDFSNGIYIIKIGNITHKVIKK